MEIKIIKKTTNAKTNSGGILTVCNNLKIILGNFIKARQYVQQIYIM